MKCDLCNSDYRRKAVVLSFQRGGKSIVVEDVPALVCERCGDTLFSASTVQDIEALIDHEPQDTAPLYRFPRPIASR